MAEGKNQLSRNPNICASCSSLADGMDDFALSTLQEAANADSASLPENPQSGRRAPVECPRNHYTNA
jgi:hypothetical protein